MPLLLFHIISRLRRLGAPLALWLMIASLAVSCSDGIAHDGPAPEIAVSNSWLESGLRDIAGDDLPLVRIMPPGSCPGHFDIRPSMVNQLRQCRWVFLFDFQQSLDERMQAIASDRVTTIAIPAPQGLSLPSSYLTGCESIHAALSAAYPDQAPRYDAALDAVRLRLAALETELRAQVRDAGLEGAKVVSSGHQSAFARWLGLEPVATYSGAETASPAQIEALLAQGRDAEVRFVIANLQESAQAGAAIAQQLDAPVVVFSNFPSMADEEQGFDALARANLDKLLHAARSAP